jgi:putative tryptophan/tyrosine transport system substrate-binding protein
MQRREFITLLGGAAAAWPLVGHAQQADRMKRIGALMSIPIDDPQSLPRVTSFAQGLQELGWTVGRNVRIDYRWGATDAERARRAASELIALTPDVILVNNGVNTGILLQATRTVPVVFVTAVDPVGAGLVASLARPGGNATGFSSADFSLGAKLLELLKEIAPHVARVAVLRDPSVPAGSAPFGAIQVAAPSFRVEVVPIDTRDIDELERGITAFARTPNGGLILAAPFFAARSRDLIISLAARHRLPAAYPSSLFVPHGGLISYGPDISNQFRLAAGYVDRILKGAKPADLPVQAPTKYLLALNMKTANALGLDVPATVRVRADELIE